MNFKNSEILVTGGGTGIGRATVEYLASHEAERIYITGRRIEKLEEVKAFVENKCDTKVVCIPCDLSSIEERQKLVEAINKGSRKLNCIVNNAGIFDSEPIEATSDEKWRAIMNLNVEAPFALIRDLLPLLKKSKMASIVNISSTLAEKPIPGATAYNASKAALIQMTRTLALELGEFGIRINSVLPAVVETEMYRNRFTDATEYKHVISQMAQMHPLKRVGQPIDIAKSVAFLASQDASWITGISMPVDGGMLCT